MNQETSRLTSSYRTAHSSYTANLCAARSAGRRSCHRMVPNNVIGFRTTANKLRPFDANSTQMGAL
jgi:hypothetical protein